MLGDLNIAEPKALIGFAGPARHRADDPPEAAGRLPAQRVPDRERHARSGRRSARDEGGDRRRAALHGRQPATPPARAAGAAAAAADGRQPPDAGRARCSWPATDPLDYLFSLEQFGIKFGLENIRAIVAALGHPERAFPRSTSPAPTARDRSRRWSTPALRAAGHRSARYTSPHLVDLTERFAIDGVAVAPTTLRRGRRCAFACRARCSRAGALPAQPTFFEVTTAVAFELFRARRGGRRGHRGRTRRPPRRHQRPNAHGHRDHVDRIRSRAVPRTTLAAIAAEKAGIIKPGVPVVVGALGPEAPPSSRDRRRARRADRRARGRRHVERAVSATATRPCGCARRRAIMAASRSRWRRAPGRATPSSPCGCSKSLDERGLGVPADGVVRGLADVSLARAVSSTVSSRTAASCSSTPRTIRPAPSARRLPRATCAGGRRWSSRAMRDKDVAGMFAALLPAVGRVVVTTARRPARSAEPDALAAVARASRPDLPVEVAPSAADAMAAAWTPSPRIVVAGSIFLLGDVLECLGIGTSPATIPRGCGSCTLGFSQRVRRCLTLLSCALVVAPGRARACATAQQVQATVNAVRDSDRSPGTPRSTTLRSARSSSSDRRRHEALRRRGRRVRPARTRRSRTGTSCLTQGNNRIAADHAEFDTATSLGTFYNASGIANVQPPRQAPRPAASSCRRDRPGHRRVLLRRDHREDRPQEIQDHQRRLHAPACSRRRAGSCSPSTVVLNSTTTRC